MSEKAKITVTRALSELGTVTARIEQAIASGLFVSVVKGDAQKPLVSAYTTSADLTSAMQASFDKVEGLVKRQEVLKAAVVKSNAATVVKIAGREMTIAEAINQKEVAKMRTRWLQTLKSQLLRASAEHQTATTKLEELIERTLSSVYTGAKDTITQAERDNVVNPLKKDHQPKIVSSKPDLNAYIRDFENDLNQFLSECDYVLSESNCQTLIEVD